MNTCKYCETSPHKHGCPNHEGQTPVERGFVERSTAIDDFRRGQKRAEQGSVLGHHKDLASAFLLGFVESL